MRDSFSNSWNLFQTRWFFSKLMKFSQNLWLLSNRMNYFENRRFFPNWWTFCVIYKFFFAKLMICFSNLMNFFHINDIFFKFTELFFKIAAFFNSMNFFRNQWRMGQQVNAIGPWPTYRSTRAPEALYRRSRRGLVCLRRPLLLRRQLLASMLRFFVPNITTRYVAKISGEISPDLSNFLPFLLGIGNLRVLVLNYQGLGREIVRDLVARYSWISQKLPLI